MGLYVRERLDRPTAFLVVWLLLLVFSAPHLGSAAEQSADPQVTQFSPQGTVKGVRQVTARFSEPMVPLGDPRGGATDPFEITCPEAGTGRWADSRNWVYDFARDLPAGVRCTFRIRPGLVTLAGKELTGQREFTFSTGGPAIRSSRPHEGSTWIDEEQAFLLVLDAEPTDASLLAHVSFAIEGIAERVGLSLITGERREALVKATLREGPPGPVVILQARQRFPNGARVSLNWGKGVASRSGVPTEEDQILSFKVRDPFTATFNCERENREADCIPVTPMTVGFRAPVPWEQARQAVVVGPDGRRWSPEPREKENPFVTQVVFTGPFPESSVFRVELPADLRDDAGRPLVNADKFPLAVKTDQFPPLAKFAARFGVVEWKAGAVLPVTLRNLEPAVRARILQVEREFRPGLTGRLRDLLESVRGKLFRIPPELSAEVLPWLRRVEAIDREHSLFGSSPAGRRVNDFTLPKPHGARALEVVGIPLGAPGLYVLELESPRLGASLLGKPRPMYVPTAALVTNLSVHFKWGRESSLAWVTTLDEGRPVPEARVTVRDCEGKVLWEGVTDPQGIARVEGLPPRGDLPRCGRPSYHDYPQTAALRGLGEGLFVTAQTPEDLSFVHSSWNQGIEPWRFRLPEQQIRSPVVGHTIFDRSLFRAGDTVHMKHLLRRQTLRGFSPVPDAERPRLISIRHVGSEEKYELPVTWDAGGVAESTWRIPREAKLGRYDVVMVRPKATPSPASAVQRDPYAALEDELTRERVSGQFRVEEFRVPLMKGTLRPPAEPLVAVSEFPLDLSLQYLAGGSAREQPVTLRTQIGPSRAAAFEAFEEFTFANGFVKEGVVRRAVGDYEEYEDGEGEPVRPLPKGKPAVHQRQELVLDAAGTARATVSRLPRASTPLDVLAELEFRDPNGEVQTVSTKIPRWPSRWLVGLKPDSWVAPRDKLNAQVAVVDVSGKPVAGASVHVELLERKAYSHRKRLVGGFYAYDHVQETRRVGELCRGVTDRKGLLTCEGKPPASGRLILQAHVRDENGNQSAAHQEVWVAGSADWWFEVGDSDRIDLLPERRRYEPGETARLQVRMPFREATALVSIEREGILEAWVLPLSGKEPVIEVPVKEAYAPNVFVSVLAIRGRVSGVQPTAMVDLGRPAFKLGLAEIRVGWEGHELRVKVSADRGTYRIREKAAVRINVETAHGKPPPPGSEVAVAAVDEGLLELLPNRSWNVLEAMMGRRGYLVRTATAQAHVVGTRHFGLKALPQGGGGGPQTTRELFDTLLLWKGRIPLDERGEAVVEVPLNDSLTSFRIVAVATGGVGLFGTGSTTIRSTQDLMVLPGIAPLVREGDRFRAEVTLRNTTSRVMDVSVAGRVEGLPRPLEPHAVRLAPGEARAVGWEVTVPVGERALRYEIEARELGGPTDRVRVTQRVASAVPVRTLQAALARWEGRMRQPVERPADALPGRGEVRVAFSPTLLTGLAGVSEWMRAYAYTCLEQQVSRAVALRDERLWRDVAATLPAHLDSDGLLKYFPAMRWGSEVLTAYVLAILDEARWTIPEAVRGKMQTGLRKFVEGAILRRSELPTTDLSIRKLAALEALSRYGKADASLLGSLTVEPNLWPTSAVLDWWSLLHRVTEIPQREPRLREAEQIVRSRLNFQGTVMGFSTERSDALWWLMVSTDLNAVRLILHLLDANQWREDLPRLLRGALARQQRGAWDLTVANAWGVLAVEKFSRTFERVPVTGTSTAALAGAAERVQWADVPKGKTLSFPWPPKGEDLVVDHEGSGHPWVTVEGRAAVPLGAPLSTGYRITRTVTPVEARQGGRWGRGDLMRVRLEVDAQADMTWVVVSDPIPAGASHLGTGLGQASRIAAQGEERAGWAWPAFIERSFEAFRAYYEYVPKGRFIVEYTVRLNQSGTFQLPTTRVEALYAPEMFGELPNAPLEVHP